MIELKDVPLGMWMEDSVTISALVEKAIALEGKEEEFSDRDTCRLFYFLEEKKIFRLVSVKDLGQLFKTLLSQLMAKKV